MTKEERGIITRYQEYLGYRNKPKLDTSTHYAETLSPTMTHSSYDIDLFPIRYYGSRHDRRVLRKYGYMDKDYNPTYKK